MRLCSFAQESTRYCNYSKDKFSGVTYIAPQWMNFSDLIEQEFTFDISNPYFLFNPDKKIPSEVKIFIENRMGNEYRYLISLRDGKTPQQARGELDHHLKTEIMVKTTIEEWKHIFSLRCDKTAHPQMVALMSDLQNQFVEQKLIK